MEATTGHNRTMYELVTWTADGTRAIGLAFDTERAAFVAGRLYLAMGCSAYRVRRVV